MCTVFPSSGAVVTMECVEKLIWKDMIDPVTGDKLKEKDIIPLQRVCIREIVLKKMSQYVTNAKSQCLNVSLLVDRVGLASRAQEWISKLKRPDPLCKHKREDWTTL